jgi:hypothetical protein
LSAVEFKISIQCLLEASRKSFILELTKKISEQLRPASLCYPFANEIFVKLVNSNFVDNTIAIELKQIYV